MQQLLFVDPNSPPKIVDLGPATGNSMREWIDNHMRESTGKATVRANRNSLNRELLEACRAKRASLEKIARKRATLYDQPKRRSATAE